MSFIKILGSCGSKTKQSATTSFLVSKNILIDAGNIINTLDDIFDIEHIFITHTHLDHIADLAFLIENNFEYRLKPLHLYASKQSLKNLQNHIFNNHIWPDFTKIALLNSNQQSLIFVELEANQEINIDSYNIKAISANHIDGSFGYVVTKDNVGYAISGDTGENSGLIEILNHNQHIKTLFIECSFPSRLNSLAQKSRHLTPDILKAMLAKLTRDDIFIYAYHLKHPYEDEIKAQLGDIKVLQDNSSMNLESAKITKEPSEQEILNQAMDINLKLSGEHDRDMLYEKILTLLRSLTKSDAGTLYIMSKDKKYLDFKVIQNDTLGIYLGGRGESISWESLPLYLEDGSKNKTMVAALCALENYIINIEDAYTSQQYNFDGTKKFDKTTGYRSKSMLVVPLINHENDVIGVIQLINKNISIDGCYFNKNDEKIIKSLSSQAAMALTNTQLIHSLEKFLDSFVTSIASAIDAKSAYTSTHIKKISTLAPMIAQAIHNDKGLYKDVQYTLNDFKEITLAAKLHDIGKISIPEAVMDKANKLSKIVDRIELITLKFEILKRDAKLEYLNGKITKSECNQKIDTLNNELDFIKKTNVGGEFMRDEDIMHLQNIAKQHLFIGDKKELLLDSDELYNLSIRKGTLTNEERDVINSHATLSYEMLNALEFPKKYSNVMHIAINHHEKLNGKGYPRGLSEKDLTLEDRILILADIFEALTSNDRPYKGIKKLSEVFKILTFMAKDGDIDANLLEFFKQSEALKQYAKEYLLKEQIDV